VDGPGQVYALKAACR